MASSAITAMSSKTPSGQDETNRDDDPNSKEEKEKARFEGMVLPEYLQITELPNVDGIKINLDLGVFTKEGERRLEEILALKTKQTNIPLMEIDGPKYLAWENFTDQIARLLLKRNVNTIAVPSDQVDRIQGRLSGLVLGTVRSLVTGGALSMAGVDVQIRDVISASILTSRIIALHPESEEVRKVKASIKVMREQNHVPKPLRPLLCSLARLIRKNERSERLNRRNLKQKRADSSPSSDKLSTCSTLSEYSVSDAESTGFDMEDEKIVIASGESQESVSKEKIQDETHVQPSSSRYCSDPIYEDCSAKCYICKKRSPIPKHHTPATQHYVRLCPCCAEMNWSKRFSGTNLDGYIALVTGGRIKIGFEIVLKLLRDGCRVITTTRFPLDAAKRFADELDYDKWKDRLQIYPLELKDSKGIYKFVEYLKQTLPFLDIIINNAAQTIRRPLDFYRHLLEYEQTPDELVRGKERHLLSVPSRMTYRDLTSKSMVAMTSQFTSQPAIALGSKPEATSSLKRKSDVIFDEQLDSDSGIPAKKRKEKNLPGPENTPDSWSEVVSMHCDENFPAGCLDEHGQQLDLRSENSWRAVLEEVPISELLEVLMINTIAPYILNKELKGLMLASPHDRRFIVNVSAMEGQFNRQGKTRYHPHTNMAKAALNMMTRTGALGYRVDSIYMTSVDTGWVTDERPFSMAAAESKKGFVVPLDCIDGAARVYDPIVMGLNKDKEPYYAVFLKNYGSHPW